jgi:hypothetical protein
MATTNPSTINAFDTADDNPTGVLNLLAAGRILIAAAALAVPRQFARLIGVTDSPELTFMTRVYGVRALAMGLAYLTGGQDERNRWKRFGLLVDTTDTASGIGHVLRRDVGLRASLSMLALSASYTVIGAIKVSADR